MKTEDTGHGILETWTVDEVRQALTRGEIAVIDVRTPQEYMFEHIDGALLGPMGLIRPDRLPSMTERPIVFYCGTSKRSENVARTLLAAGHPRIVHMAGGFTAWKEAGYSYIGTDMATGAPVRIDPRTDA